MDQYLKLRSIFTEILPTGSKENFYFQPPDGKSLNYPCIVCKLIDTDVQYADDKPYLLKDKYQITVIDKDPLSSVHKQVALLQLCKIRTAFSTTNLNHFVYEFYF